MSKKKSISKILEICKKYDISKKCDTTRAENRKIVYNLRDYIEEKFSDMNNKYDELKATLSNDTVEIFKRRNFVRRN